MIQRHVQTNFECSIFGENATQPPGVLFVFLFFFVFLNRRVIAPIQVFWGCCQDFYYETHPEPLSQLAQRTFPDKPSSGVELFSLCAFAVEIHCIAYSACTYTIGCTCISVGILEAKIFTIIRFVQEVNPHVQNTAFSVYLKAQRTFSVQVFGLAPTLTAFIFP